MSGLCVIPYHEPRCDAENDRCGRPLGPEENCEEVSYEVIKDSPVFCLVGILGRLRLPRAKQLLSQDNVITHVIGSPVGKERNDSLRSFSRRVQSRRIQPKLL